MSIHMKSLSPLTYRALEGLSEQRGWPDMQVYMEPQDVAWLTFRLKYVEDSEEDFPHGKWATIQRLQQMVEDAARADALYRVVEGI